MWKTFFTVCDLLCNLIPNKKQREYVQRVRLHDWRRKYRALRDAFPNLSFRHTKMIKGGWNIGFIVDKKYVFKIRKQFDKYDENKNDRIIREKRITDAFANISPLRIPKIEIINAGGYTFYKYDFIPGKNMNALSQHTIEKYRDRWAAQLAEFIYAIHNSNPSEIKDLRAGDGDGWNHNDICNNIIVDAKKMKIIGLIDWEYAGWGNLQDEFNNVVAFSKKIRASKLGDAVISTYNKLSDK